MADRGVRPQPDPEPIPLLIQGLIAELPPRSKPFSRQARERWLAALKVNLDLVYGDEDEDAENVPAPRGDYGRMGDRER